MDGEGRLCFQGGNFMKLKRILAVAMATTMVMGMSLTAFAEDGSTGDGTSEGTVNKNILMLYYQQIQPEHNHHFHM
jgi:hypothetical protein